MTGKGKTTKAKPEGGISISGGVRGTGNVVGHGSESHVSVRGEARKADKARRRSDAGERVMGMRVWAFLLALIGTVAAIALFTRLQQGLDTLTVAELVFAALVAALGISGTIKPQAVVDLLAKLFGKG